MSPLMPRRISLALCAIAGLLTLFDANWASALNTAGRYGAQAQAYWNVWMRELNTSGRVAVLAPGRAYTMSLDVSRVSYDGSQAELSPELARELGRKRISTFVVRSIVDGDSIEIARGSSQRTIQIDARRLAGSALSDADIERLRTDLTLSLARSIRAGALELKVVARHAGCAVVTFSIWDESGMLPLDQIAARLYVGEVNDLQASACLASSSQGSATSGFAATLDAAVNFKGGDPPVDGALYIFDAEDSEAGGRTVSMYVDRRMLKQRSTGTRANADCRQAVMGVYSWSMKRRASDVLSPGFFEQLRAARGEIAPAELAKTFNVNFPYQEVAATLRDQIFPPTEPAAMCALLSLQESVRRVDHQPRLLVRVMDAAKRPIYLPVGLLSARSATPILERRIAVVEPLPRLNYSTNTCVRSWTFGVSDDMRDAADKALPRDLDALQSAGPGWFRDRLRDRRALTSYFEQTSAGSAEGLLLLAHHYGGDLWYENQASRIVPDSIAKHFPAGSVGVLAVCAAAGPATLDRLLSDTLNENGMDAIIMSPVPVPVAYGERFTREFAKSLGTAFAKQRPTSLLDVYNQTTEATIASLGAAGVGNLPEDMPLEFIIAGNHGTKICGTTHKH